MLSQGGMMKDLLIPWQYILENTENVIAPTADET